TVLLHWRRGVDQRTNTLLVSDTSERVDEVRSLVEELDRPVRQVLIESRIVIARHDFNYELGVRFGVTSSLEDGRGNVFSTSGSSNALDDMNNLVLINRRGNSGSSLPSTAPDPIIGNGIIAPTLGDRLNVNLPVSSPAGRLGFSVLAADYLLDLELSALESEGNGEVISTPRVIAANQAEAFIKQGVEIPYEEATSSGASSVQFQEAVLELRVVPLITPDNRVQLDLNVKQDTVGEIFQTGRGGTVPSIDTRELATNVLVDNGQTVVLGGIFQEERNFTSSKVPVLGDVPVLGHLFRRRGNQEQKRELLIFVTPSILDDRTVLD
ncbi:MAG: type IV pilus secretin PilQ, partial [Pseudomonadota bacterium]